MAIAKSFHYVCIKHLLKIFREPLASHSDDNVCGGSLCAHFIVHGTCPLVGVVVAPQCQVNAVLLHIKGSHRNLSTIMLLLK